MFNRLSDVSQVKDIPFSCHVSPFWRAITKAMLHGYSFTDIFVYTYFSRNGNAIWKYTCIFNFSWHHQIILQKIGVNLYSLQKHMRVFFSTQPNSTVCKLFCFSVWWQKKKPTILYYSFTLFFLVARGNFLYFWPF